MRWKIFQFVFIGVLFFSIIFSVQARLSSDEENLLNLIEIYCSGKAEYQQYLFLGNLLENYQLYPEAQRVYFEGLAHHPKDSELLLSLGRVSLSSGDCTKALYYFRWYASCCDPSNIEYLKGMIGCYLQMNNPQMARSMVLNLPENLIVPDSNLVKLACQCLCETGDALNLKRFNQIIPENTYLHYYYNGWLNYFEHNYEQAFSEFVKCLSFVSEDSWAIYGKKLCAEAMISDDSYKDAVKKIEYLEFLKKYEKALEIAEDQKKLNPYQVLWENYAAYFYFCMGNLDLSRNGYSAIIAQKRGTWETHRGLLLNLILLGENTENSLLTLCYKWPADFDASLLNGINFLRKKEYFQAQKLFYRFYSDKLGMLGYGFSLLFQGDIANSKSVFAEILKDNPEDILALTGYRKASGWIKENEGKKFKQGVLDQLELMVLTQFFISYPNINSDFLLKNNQNKSFPMRAFIAEKLRMERKFNDSVKILEEIMQYQTDPFALHTLGDLYFQLNDLVSAEICYLKSDKYNWLPWVNRKSLGEIYLSTENKKAFFEIIRQVTEMEMKAADIQLLKARWYFIQGNYSESLIYLENIESLSGLRLKALCYNELADTLNTRKYLILSLIRSPFDVWLQSIRGKWGI